MASGDLSPKLQETGNKPSQAWDSRPSCPTCWGLVCSGFISSKTCPAPDSEASPGSHLASCFNSPWVESGQGNILPGSPPAPGLGHASEPQGAGIPWDISGHRPLCFPTLGCWITGGRQLVSRVALAACHATGGGASPANASSIHLSPGQKQTSMLCPGGIPRNLGSGFLLMKCRMIWASLWPGSHCAIGVLFCR